MILYIKQFGLGDQPEHSKAKAIVGRNVRPAYENEFPYVVCILKYDPDLSWENKRICTGTLITESHVITAEHCFEVPTDIRIEIAVGGYNIDDGIRHYPLWWISYDQWICSLGQQVTNLYNDILIAKVNYLS